MIAGREFSARMKQWRMIMTMFKTLIAAALISTATIPSAFAAWSFADQEPAAYASMYPNRDVLNGGALTPRINRQGGRDTAERKAPRSVIRGAAATCGAPCLLFETTAPAALSFA